MNEYAWSTELTDFHTDINKVHYMDIASRLHALHEINHPKNITLEIGSSSGYFIRDFKNKYPKHNIISSDYIIPKKHPDVTSLQLDILNLPFKPNSIDTIILLNVLEHIKNDYLALQQIYKILKPNGTLIIEVPANPNLYDFYDKVLKHYRRYTLSELVHISESCGFKILNKSHLGFFIYPAFKLVKLINRKKTSDSDITDVKKMITINPLTNYILTLLMKTELIIGKIVSYPFGIRCLITLRK